MKIPLQKFKDCVQFYDTDDVIHFLQEVHDTYSIDYAEVLEKYRKLCRISGRECGVTLCHWTGVFCSENDSYRDMFGQTVSYEARRSFGITCSQCSNLADKRFYRFFRVIVDLTPGVRQFCQVCVNNLSERFFHRESNIYYANLALFERYHMPNTINWDELKFSSREELFSSYRSRGRDYPVLPVDQQSYDIQHSMDGSHSGDPLRHRAGFLFDENESLPLVPHWLGVELEVEPSDLGVKTPGFFYKVASTLNKHTIIKPDGSLGPGGFEICSVPATLKKHYELWEDFFEKASPLLHAWNTGRCGMHVHMNKAFYADSAMGKALVFVNSEENRPFIELVAGRKSNQYMKLHPKKLVDYRTGVSEGHYEALSISRHTGRTLELRIFRSNVRKAGFFKNLEFADALGHFVHETSIKALRSKDFLAWITQDHNRSRYQYFIGWAITQKLFERKKGDKIPLQIKKFSVPKTVKENFAEAVAA